MLGWVWSWLRGRRARPRDHLRFTLYVRDGCHLCDVALAELRRQQADFRFHLEMVDVDGVPELAVRYGEMVPVVEINGKRRFWGRINRVLLRRLLLAEERPKKIA